MNSIEEKIKKFLPEIEVIPDSTPDSEKPEIVTVVLDDENKNGDNFVVLVGKRADNTAYVSFYEDYYDPDNCTEYFECKDIDHAIKILVSGFIFD